MTRSIAPLAPARALKAGTDGLRSRLLALRRDAPVQLAEGDGIDAGLLALAANAGAALMALDTAAMDSAVLEPADRAVVLDDSVTIQIAVFRADRQAARVALTLAAATRLA